MAADTSRPNAGFLSGWGTRGYATSSTASYPRYPALERRVAVDVPGKAGPVVGISKGRAVRLLARGRAPELRWEVRARAGQGQDVQGC